MTKLLFIINTIIIIIIIIQTSIITFKYYRASLVFSATAEHPAVVFFRRVMLTSSCFCRMHYGCVSIW